MHELQELAKMARPSVSLDLLAQKFPNLKGNSDNQSMYDLLKDIMLCSGINHIVQVHDCEAATYWTESDDGTLDVTAGTTGKRVGTNCICITNTAATDGTQYVETKYINETAAVPSKEGLRQMDWRDIDYLGFWKHAESSAHFGTDGELKFAIVNNGVVNGSTTAPGTAQDPISVDGTAGTVHHWCEIDLRNYARDRVEAIRFYGNNSNVGEVTYIDDIIRYKISYNKAPYYGSAFPIKSGTTLTEGNTGTWSIDGMLAASSAAAVTDLGPVWLRGNATLTGTAKRNKWAIVPGLQIVLYKANAANTAGDLQEWAADGYYTDVTTTATGKGVIIALEAAGAQYDWVFGLLRKVGTSA